MKIRITYTEEALGTACANPEVHGEFIASKSADKAKAKEELEALDADVLLDKAITVFAKDGDGNPFWWDYQIRGYIKEFLQFKTEFSPFVVKVRGKDIKFSKWTYKRLVDNFIFVTPRKIRLNIPRDKEMGLCTRSLRATTMRGDRTALATSETVPAGTTCEFEVHCLQKELFEMLEECFDYGQFKGLSQWRNSGKGRFIWELLE